MDNQRTSSTGLDWIAATSAAPRIAKQLIQLLFDSVALPASFAISYWLLIDIEGSSLDLRFGVLFVLLSMITAAVRGVYAVVIRFSGFHLVTLIVANQLAVVVILYMLSILLSGPLTALSCWLLFLTSIFAMGGGRFLARKVLDVSSVSGERILIYGTGRSAVQLMASIRRSHDYFISGFIDEVGGSNGLKIHGLPVFTSAEIEVVIKSNEISTIVLSDRSIAASRNKMLLAHLEGLPVAVKHAPLVTDFLNDESSGEIFLEDIGVEDIVGREAVNPNRALMRRNIVGKTVLVTGAGGSIGSELCRQITRLSPSKLIILENSEFALFNILEELAVCEVEMVPKLGSVCDEGLVNDLFAKQNIDTVFHAAAYKHVPLVESNAFSGVYNNVFGTKIILDAAIRAQVDSFTLISTDKAVRPTNIMGASKRISEIICQQVASTRPDTVISMVRFGNVIGSSGSVIPKFREQIRRGGPVTVTHPEITRFFMGIPEASELVLQASALAEGGDVFVLDMGEPVLIKELVEKLIRFSGRVVKTEKHTGRDAIEIVYTGLRPGEKLYEELLISGEEIGTKHPKILKMSEPYPDFGGFASMIDDLNEVIRKKDLGALKELFLSYDIGYTVSNDFSGRNPSSGESSLRILDPNRSVRENQKSSPSPLKDIQPNSSCQDHRAARGKTIASSLRAWRGLVFRHLLHVYFLLSRGLTVGVRCVVLNEKKEVLLVRHSYTDGWHLPGGGIGIGESAEEAVKREVFEETAHVLDGALTQISVTHCKDISKRDHIILFYSETFLKPPEDSISFEISAAKFYRIDKLPGDVDKMSVEWLQEALLKKQELEGYDSPSYEYSELKTRNKTAQKLTDRPHTEISNDFRAGEAALRDVNH